MLIRVERLISLIVDVNCCDVNPMNMSIYSDVLLDTRKYASLNQLKNVFRSVIQICSNTTQTRTRSFMQS